VEDFNTGKISPWGSPGLGFREKRLFLEQKSVILWILLKSAVVAVAGLTILGLNHFLKIPVRPCK